jgi:hypothetical protein
MIKLTTEREITPYVWVHPDDDKVTRGRVHGQPRTTIVEAKLRVY